MGQGLESKENRTEKNSGEEGKVRKGERWCLGGGVGVLGRREKERTAGPSGTGDGTPSSRLQSPAVKQ